MLAVLPILGFAQTGAKNNLTAQKEIGGIEMDALGANRIDNVLLVDGTRYRTLASALAVCRLPGCVVYDNFAETFTANPFSSLSANVFAEVHMMRRTWISNASIVIPNKSQLLGSGRGDAGSTGTVIQAGSSFPAGSPVIQMGTAPSSTAVRIENLTVDCNNRNRAIGIQNLRSQEESGIRHILIQNCSGSGLDIESSAAQNSGPYEDLEVLDNAGCRSCSTATVPIIVKMVPAFRGVHGATVNSFGATEPSVGMQVDSQGTFSDIHCEHVVACLVLGSQAAVGAAIATNLECGPSTKTCVLFSGAFPSQNLTALSIASSTGNLVEDQINGNTIVASTEGGSLALYSIGNGKPQSILTTSTSINSRFRGVALLGSTGTINHLAPSAAGTNTITDPAASGTTSLAVFEYCGATAGGTQACANSVQPLPITVWGDVRLNSTTSQSITKLPFTDALYSCTGSDLTTSAGIVTFNGYTPSSVTLLVTNGTIADDLRYICVGH